MPGAGPVGIISPMGTVTHVIDAETRRDMLRQLARLRRRGDRVVSIGAAPGHARLGGVEPVHRPLGSATAAGWRLGDRPGSDTDALHAWSPDALRAAREAGLATGLPVVVSLPAAPRGAELADLQRLIGAGLASVTVPTHADASALRRADLPAGMLHVLPPAAEPAGEDAGALGAAARAELDIGEADVCFAVTQPMVRGAGHDLAAWAHGIVRQVRGGVPLIFHGGGPLADSVRFFAGTTGYDDEHHFVGDAMDLRAALAAADAAAVFQRRPVGTHALAEAIAAGLPVAAAATPAAVELAGGGRDALLVPPDDPRAAAGAMLRLIEEGELRDRLGAAAAAAAQRFAPDAARKTLQNIYAAAGAATVY